MNDASNSRALPRATTARASGSALSPERSGGAAFAAQIEQDKAHRAKSRSLRPLRALWPFVAKYPGWIAAFLIFLALSAAATLTLPLIFKLIVDCGFSGNPEANPYCARMAVGGAADLGGYFKLALIFGAVFASLGAMRFYFITTLGQRVVADIRKAVYAKLLTLSPAYFERVRTGEVLSRLTTDTTLVETVMTGSISFAIRSVVTVIGSVIMMFVVNWRLGLIVMAVLPVIIVPAILQGRRIRVLSRDGQDALADASARSGEALTAIQTVQAFSRERYERSAFEGSIEATFKSQRARIFRQSTLTAFVIAAGLCGIIASLWFGAESVKAGTMTGGDIIAFTVFAFYVGSSGGALTETWTNLLRAAGASERLVDILNASSEIVRPETNAVLLKSARGEIGFDKVDFTYPTRPDDAALRGVSFTVSPGETVALVGPSGAGKSTIFQLLLRFYDVSGGHVTLDGKRLSQFDPLDLRKYFAIVQQNTPLFSGSAMDNIRYGRIEASDTEVIEAAKAAFAHDFITALPEGYDTDLGERAMTLSGGQRQRIAIARAILRDAPILLLDEATSALDAESEQAVQRAFDAMSTGRTTLVIAHRLATVKKADRIIVLDEGRIVGQGTHDSLIKDDGLYARLAALQFDQN